MVTSVWVWLSSNDFDLYLPRVLFHNCFLYITKGWEENLGMLVNGKYVSIGGVNRGLQDTKKELLFLLHFTWASDIGLFAYWSLLKCTCKCTLLSEVGGIYGLTLDTETPHFICWFIEHNWIGNGLVEQTQRRNRVDQMNENWELPKSTHLGIPTSFQWCEWYGSQNSSWKCLLNQLNKGSKMMGFYQSLIVIFIALILLLLFNYFSFVLWSLQYLFQFYSHVRRKHGSCGFSGSHCGRSDLSHLHELPEGTREHGLWPHLLSQLCLRTLGDPRRIPKLELHLSPLSGSCAAKEPAA
jgi:hypothetical protein